jgi:hypothetical protein
MKRSGLVFVLWLGAITPMCAKTSQPSASSQLRLKATSKQGSGHIQPPAIPAKLRPGHVQVNPQRRAPAGSVARKVTAPRGARRFGNVANTVQFASASRTFLGGSDDDNTVPVLGDFNGDGKKEPAKIIDNNGTHYITVALNNGDGTFQSAQLTATPNNSDDPIMVGDLNGDGKDDLIQLHVSSGCDLVRQGGQVNPAESFCGSSFDVLLSNGDGTFALGNNYAVSEYVLAGAVLTDYNDDGKIDLLAIDEASPSSVWLLTGNGDGTFGTESQATTLSASVTAPLFFADFNGDGKLDFGWLDNGQVGVFLAAGSNFTSPNMLTTSDTTYYANFCTAGDLNGDSKPEIVCVNEQENTVTIYVNNGDGSFQTGVYNHNAGDINNVPIEASIGDFNGDGKPDVVLGNEYSGEITILLGNGDGTVTASPVAYGVGGYPWSAPLVDDFNGDGYLDVLTSDDWYNWVYLEGYGDGTFLGSRNDYLPGSFSLGAFTESVVVGDFNGDGIPDVVSGEYQDTANPGIFIYLGNGDGTFQPGVNIPASSSNLGYVAVGDFNGDGKLDIAASDYSTGVVQIFLGQGDGTFSLGGSYATDTAADPRPFNIAVGDFNHDGKLDLAVANDSTSSVGVLLGNGDGTFAPVVPYSLSGLAYDVVAQDLNGDGYLDLAVTLDQSIAILLGHTDNTGTFGPESDVAVSGYPDFVTFGDLNGDGKMDLVTTTEEGNLYLGALVVALGNGDGTFQTPAAYPSSAEDGGADYTEPGNIQLVDLNGDGKLDAVYLLSQYGTIAVALGNGDGTFATPVEFPMSLGLWGMAVADLNHDGALDIVAGNDDSGGIDILLNGNGRLTPAITWPTPAAVTFGTALSGTQLDATASVPGTFVYTPAAGTVPAVGSDTLSVTFTPNNTAKYSTATASVTLTVNAGNGQTPAITWATPAAVTQGTALSGTQLDATANVAGTFVYSPPAGTIPALGLDTLTVTFTPNDTVDYTTATASVVLTVGDFFTLSLSGSGTQTIQQSSSATYNFIVAPTGMSVFPGVVNLSASGLPAGARATFSPSSIPAGSGSTPVTLTVATASTNGALTKPTNKLALGVLLLPLLGLVPIGFRSRRRGRILLMAMFGLLSLAAMTTMQGCGDCDSDDRCKVAPTSTNYTIAVTATSGRLSHSSDVTLTIKQ